jgi:hypothetical protein
VTELLTLPPTPEAITAMIGIPKMSIAPTILATQQGVERHVHWRWQPS